MQTPSQTLPLTTPANDHRTGTLYCLGATTLFSLLFILSLSSTSQPPSPPPSPDPFLFPNRRSQSKRIVFLDQKLPSDSSSPTPPSIAYLISGSANDSNRILRLLFAVYHPRNYYLLHLNRSASQHDRYLLALTLQSIPVFRAAQNVNVIGKADFTYAKGSSSLSSTLHGASLLLRISTNWDWFINLSAEDYPLVTQDDLLHILSYLPKDFNFVKHTSQIGWRESRKLKPIIVDPAFYLSEENQIYYATQTRKLPDAYRLFTSEREKF